MKDKSEQEVTEGNPSAQQKKTEVSGPRTPLSVVKNKKLGTKAVDSINIQRVVGLKKPPSDEDSDDYEDVDERN